MTKKNAGVQEFRSSGVQESSELGTLLRIGATSQAYSWVSSPPLSQVQNVFQAGSESPSERHSELLNSSILNSFQMLDYVCLSLTSPTMLDYVPQRFRKRLKSLSKG